MSQYMKFTVARVLFLFIQEKLRFIELNYIESSYLSIMFLILKNFPRLE